MGQAGMLDTARFTNFVAEELSVPVGSVTHADARLARRHDGAGAVAPARSTASRWRTCCRRTRSRSWSPGPATAAPRWSRCSRPARRTTRPSAAAARMARAVAEDSGAVLPVCAWVDGEYGISGVYLGRRGRDRRAAACSKVVERDLTDAELAALTRGRRGGPRQAGGRRGDVSRAPRPRRPHRTAGPQRVGTRQRSATACDASDRPSGRAAPRGRTDHRPPRVRPRRPARRGGRA